MIQIFKILINNNEIKNNEKIYREIIILFIKCLNRIIDETIKIERNLRNCKNISKSRIKLSIRDNSINLLINNLTNGYMKIITDILDVIINNKEITKIFMEKGEDYIEKSLFHGILKNTFSSISELISQFYFKLFKKFETIKD